VCGSRTWTPRAERQALEQWNLIVRAEKEFLRGCGRATAGGDYSAVQALAVLSTTSHALAAITGAQTDRMTRDDGWQLLSIGRHIERLGFLAQALACAFSTGAVHDDSGYEALLALFDSTITFHAHYQQRRDLVALLDMLVTHRDNPRSLAWVLSTLRARVGKLPDAHGLPAHSLLEQVPDPAGWDLIALSGALAGPAGQQNSYLGLLELLQACERGAYDLSDRLGHAYFSHADRVNRSILS